MRHQSHSHAGGMLIDAGRQIAQLREVLMLVEELAGHLPAPSHRDAALDEAAWIASLYQAAEPIMRRRFDTLAAETAAWSAAGAQALLAAGEKRSPAAVRRLADELAKTLSDLAALLPQAAARQSSPTVPRATPSP